MAQNKDTARPLAISCIDAAFLTATAKDAREHQATVAAQVNPTNIFALKYAALADACDDLLTLFSERGHKGVPTDVL